MGKFIVLSEEQQLYILNNWDKIPARSIGKKIGVSEGVVRREYVKKGITISKSLTFKFRSEKMSARTKVTPEQDEEIKRLYLEVPVKRLAKMLGIGDTCLRIRLRQLNLIIPKEIINKRIKESRFYKNQPSWNKGLKWDDFMSPEGQMKSLTRTFKNKRLPHNTIGIIGHITIRSKKDGSEAYKYVCVSIKPFRWELYHRSIWEKQYGKIPENYTLWFIDGDTMNCVLENLECISKAENLRRNNLTDTAIASKIARGGGRGKVDNELKDYILKHHPELIDIRRQELLLKQELKK